VAGARREYDGHEYGSEYEYRYEAGGESGVDGDAGTDLVYQAHLHYAGHGAAANVDGIVNTHTDGSTRGAPMKLDLPSEPSMRFARETWWDVLLGMYSEAHGSSASTSTSSTLSLSLSLPQALPPGAREYASQRVLADLRQLFRISSYWLSFINAPRLLCRLRGRDSRGTVQPSFVWATLALATFLRSSDAPGERGAEGRAHALRMRDEAQAALEASLAARWVDDGLVQASWVNILLF